MRACAIAVHALARRTRGAACDDGSCSRSTRRQRRKVDKCRVADKKQTNKQTNKPTNKQTNTHYSFIGIDVCVGTVHAMCTRMSITPYDKLHEPVQQESRLRSSLHSHCNNVPVRTQCVHTSGSCSPGYAAMLDTRMCDVQEPEALRSAP